MQPLGIVPVCRPTCDDQAVSLENWSRRRLNASGAVATLPSVPGYECPQRRILTDSGSVGFMAVPPMWSGLLENHACIPTSCRATSQEAGQSRSLSP
jgi:hypothetical protein